VLGGPFYQLCLRSRLVRPAVELVERRIVAFAAAAWLPLLVLSILDGNAAGGTKVPFLLDPDVHVRFLLALPVLIWAELAVHHYLSLVVSAFVERRIVGPGERARFDAIIAASMRWRNSVAAEVMLILVSTTLGYWLWRSQIALHVDAWYATRDETQGTALTMAGWWYAFVSLNLLRFILLRWYYRILIWYVLLWRVSRLPLQLNALHPDRAGGLGFLGISLRAFSPILIAHTVLLGGAIAGHILNEGMQLPAFQLEILFVIACLIAIPLLPLACFVPALLRTRVQGMRDYGLLAVEYVDDFRDKWIRQGSQSGEQLIGSADIQSLADLGNAHDVVQSMRMFPLSRADLASLAVMLALPLVPLTLTMIPVDELVSRVVERLL
jgi:hypothetical protein